MLVTDDAALADRARTMRLHGIGRDAWKRYTAAGSWYYEIEAAGFKDNLTDVAAAIGLVQLERAAELARGPGGDRRAVPGGPRGRGSDGRLVLPATGSGDEHAWHLFVVRLGASARSSRGHRHWTFPAWRACPAASRHSPRDGPAPSTALRRAGIGTSVHFIPLHLHPLYPADGLPARPVPGRRGRLRRRHQPADLARDDGPAGRSSDRKKNPVYWTSSRHGVEGIEGCSRSAAPVPRTRHPCFIAPHGPKAARPKAPRQVSVAEMAVSPSA